METIKTFEDACKALNLPETLPVVAGLSDRFQKYTVAAYKLSVIAEALNEGWKPDFDNWDERKYYPWFDLSSGFGFSVTYCSYSNTAVGARLCFKTDELAEYAGTQFLEIYKDFLTL